MNCNEANYNKKSKYPVLCINSVIATVGKKKKATFSMTNGVMLMFRNILRDYDERTFHLRLC